MFHGQAFFQHQNEEVNTHRNPNLRPHGVVVSSEKSFDAQVLFDPFEEQFHMPTVFVNLRDGLRTHNHVVGQKHKSFAGFTINEFNSSDEFRVILDRICCDKVLWSP